MRRYISKDICSGGIIYFNVYGKETRPSNRDFSFESETVSKTDPKVQFTMDASTACLVSVTQSDSRMHCAVVEDCEGGRKTAEQDLFNKSNYQATPKAYYHWNQRCDKRDALL